MIRRSSVTSTSWSGPSTSFAPSWLRESFPATRSMPGCARPRKRSTSAGTCCGSAWPCASPARTRPRRGRGRCRRWRATCNSRAAALDLRADSKVYLRVMTHYQISALARLTGTPRTTLRYYEQAGLLEAGRSPSGYRLYGEQAVGRLGFIASAKRLGLPLTQIRELLAESDDGMCADVRRRLRPMLVSRMVEAQRHAAEFLAQADRLRRALADVDGPPHQGRCEPGCGCVQPG